MKKRKIEKFIRKRVHAGKRRTKRQKQLAARVRIGIIVSAVCMLAIAAYLNVPGTVAHESGRLVTFHDRGKDRVILTNADTVRQALRDAGIAVDAKDTVEPAIDSKLLSTDSAVIINRARPVMVVDGAFRERVLTPAQSPNEIAAAVGIEAIGNEDKATITHGNFISDGASTILTVERATPAPKLVFGPTPRTLTRSKGAQLYTDSNGVTHRETYYDLPMNIVIGACGPGDYTIRYDGAKIDKDGYVLVAANYRAYPKCSVVETSMGPGKVYDTGGFALRYPHGFDLATDWTNNNGR